jgi:hypothetical protein
MSSAAAAGEVTGLDVATFVIAVLALLLAALGLGCQILTHFLTGGRVKVELRIGAMAGNGSGMVTAPATNDRRAGWGDELAQQGYTRPAAGVCVELEPGQFAERHGADSDGGFDWPSAAAPS